MESNTYRLGGFRFPLVAGTFVIQSQLMEATDKGKAAAVVTITHTYDKQTGKLLFENQSTVFIRGSGGFGGKKHSNNRGSASAINKPPNQKPDSMMTEKTDPKQAALYRLTGNFNPSHIDPAFSSVGGFENPILHGLCFFGIFGQHIYEKFGPYQDIQVRFVGLVYPGETIETYMWKEANKVIFAALVTPSDRAICMLLISLHAYEVYCLAWGALLDPSRHLPGKLIALMRQHISTLSKHRERGMATRAEEQSEPASHKVEGQKVRQKDSIPILKSNEAITIRKILELFLCIVIAFSKIINKEPPTTEQQQRNFFENYLSRLCDDQSGKEGVYLIKLLRSHRLPVEALISLKSKFMPLFSKMTWPDICEIWNQYKDHTNVPSYEPDELYIPGSFATQVFHAIEKAEMDTCRLSAATTKPKWLLG
ncbi:hypothetical protein H4Q26_014855 [Puccinia striiformis f. sp. tritici PST-130]|nr:hypothetical protein H4Q26_014855 [Puccinia striiformis f. sp. tritici PST-130]